MQLPDHIFALIKALHARNRALAEGDDDARRALQQKIVETAVARFPAEGWGWKKAGQGRPPSKDAIANNRLSPGHLLSWDCFIGATREPARSESETIDDQVFIPVNGVDHLAGQPVEPAPRVPAAPGPVLPAPDEFLTALRWLDTLYREQLQRPGGVDFEGIAAHLFDTYLNARLHDMSQQDARATVVKRINAILGRADIHV